MKRALVTGAGGFIGWHLTNYLKRRGDYVRGIDVKKPEFAPSTADEFLLLDLREMGNAIAALVGGFDEVYALAADMGGMGFISSHHADILRDNLLININTLEAARQAGVGRYFFSSSACVYPEYRQQDTNAPALEEWMAYPAQPQDAYGWEKLTTENLLQHYANDYGMEVRIARFHNVYGPFGTWTGGREKAPAAMCRKVAESKLGINKIHGINLHGKHAPVVEMWGDGEQTRSFMHVDDCVEGVYRLMQSDYGKPLNVGSDHMVSIKELLRTVSDIAKQPVHIRHIAGPEGVRGRNSNNDACREVLGWEPTISLRNGLTNTYAWIEQQVRDDHEVSA